MPFGTMHLMGMLRIVDANVAVAWPRRTPHRAVTVLREAGYNVHFVPEHDQFDHGKGFNIVTLGPGKILMAGNNPVARRFYESLQIECIETPASELSRAAGATGCLTGIVMRDTGEAG
jgi:N-dimethylarginine dimethylaminohydrolase